MVVVTGTVQKEAWDLNVLPPVEQVRPGLWSLPVPIPNNPLRYVGMGMGPKPPIEPVQPTVSAVSGCSSLIAPGDPANFNGNFTLSPGTLQIKSKRAGR